MVCSSFDDFWPEPTSCSIDIMIRQICLYILLVCSSCNFLLAIKKLWNQKPLNKWPLSRPQRASLLVGLHYASVVGLVGILLVYQCRVLDCLSSVLVTALSVWWGCLSHALRLTDILVIALRTKGISSLRYQKWTRGLKKMVVVSSCGGAGVWLLCSLGVFFGQQAEYMFRGMWLSVGLTLYFWTGGFLIYGRQIIRTLTFLEASMQNQTHYATLGHIQKMIRFLVIIAFFTGSGTFLVALVPWIYERTIYFFAALGSLLSLADFGYLLMLKTHPIETTPNLGRHITIQPVKGRRSLPSDFIFKDRVRGDPILKNLKLPLDQP